MDFLKDFEKAISKMDGVTGESAAPSYWFSSGNYMLNKITSGSYYNCVPQSRITNLSGSSGCLTEYEDVRVYVMRTKDYDRQVAIDPSEDFKCSPWVLLTEEDKDKELEFCNSDSSFLEHVEHNLTLINIKTLIDVHAKDYVLIDTPDGVQTMNDFFIKTFKPCVYVSTTNHDIECSERHLLQTDYGWILSKDLTLGISLLTQTGYEPVLNISSLENQDVYDFEVAHTNHRYWSGNGISSHNSGKSFIACNIIANAQKAGAFNLVIDSENALDDEFVTKIGVDTTDKYLYKSVTTIQEVTKLVSAFLKGYKKENAHDMLAGPKVHITIDSLDMLNTDTEISNFDKGDTKGDFGGRAKMLKAMLRTFVQSIKGTNITMVTTTQVYANQDILNGEGKWIVNSAVKYAMSQIILIDKAKLKDKNDPKNITGIRMRCEGYKTRFTKPFQKVEIHVPYESGMDPLSGLLDSAVASGIVKQGGAWYTLISTDEKFQSKNLDKFTDKILQDLEGNFIVVEEDLVENEEFLKQ